MVNEPYFGDVLLLLILLRVPNCKYKLNQSCGEVTGGTNIQDRGEDALILSFYLITRYIPTG